MITQYTTESGSIYFINNELKTWYRIQGKDAAKIRTDFGTYNEIDIDLSDDPWKNGIFMICPPLEYGDQREISSTRIISSQNLESWNHPYVTDHADICVICGQVGSYIHTDPKVRG